MQYTLQNVSTGKEFISFRLPNGWIENVNFPAFTIVVMKKRVLLLQIMYAKGLLGIEDSVSAPRFRERTFRRIPARSKQICSQS